jgi:hypothetical protein
MAAKRKHHRVKRETPIDISFVIIGAPSKNGAGRGFTFTGNLGKLPKGKKAIAEMARTLAAALEDGLDLTGCGFDLHHTGVKATAPKGVRK